VHLGTSLFTSARVLVFEEITFNIRIEHHFIVTQSIIVIGNCVFISFSKEQAKELFDSRKLTRETQRKFSEANAVSLKTIDANLRLLIIFFQIFVVKCS